MSPSDLDEPCGRYLSFAEREEIAVLFASEVSIRQIALRLGRAPSTVSRELRRGRGARPYRAGPAQGRAELRARRPKVAKLAACERLRQYVQDRLGGDHRWSPQQICARLVQDFPDDEHMRVSHEAIYQALCVQGRGALRRELTACLRTGRAVRKPRRRAQTRGTRVIAPELMISARPAEVADRAVPGHWEGDLIIGAGGASAIGTLVERTTRYTMLLHLNGRRDAPALRDAIAATITTLPAHLRRSLTWDQGAEMSAHAQIASTTTWTSTSATPTHPGNAAPTRTPTGYCASTSPKAPI